MDCDVWYIGTDALDEIEERLPGLYDYIASTLIEKTEASPELETSNNVEVRGAAPDPQSGQLRTTYIFRISRKGAESWRTTLRRFLREVHISEGLTEMDCISALFWVEITRARYVDLGVLEEGAKLFMPVNARSRHKPPISATYVGNMSTTAVATYPTAGLAELAGRAMPPHQVS
ncbi:hypothetical protein F5Y05DRAFT_10020 [Hypoxylon sp. FL0543]|nr:hypothetical protein F5Y05DRAFT_10020 [Hypoxylon sp. FL0543]